jgi:hypothetical protein
MQSCPVHRAYPKTPSPIAALCKCCHECLEGPFTALYRAAVLGPPFTAGDRIATTRIASPIHGASRSRGLSHCSEKPCEQG